MLEYGNRLSAAEFCELRSAVQWIPIPEEQARSGLDHADFIISCRDGEKVVGCARILWDKGYIAYLADVMVRPEYQKQGIGKHLVGECIAFVDRQLKPGWLIEIVMIAAKGKEPFYEKFGFQNRPNAIDGAGMHLWRSL